jgi:hypothetical protein
MENNSKTQLGLLAPIRFTTSQNKLQNNFNHKEFGKNLDDSLERLYQRTKELQLQKLYTESQTMRGLNSLELSISKSESKYSGLQTSLKISQLKSIDPICTRNLYLSINFGFTNPNTFLGCQISSPKPTYNATILNPNNPDNKKNRAESFSPIETVGQLRCNYKTVNTFGTCLELLANLDNYFLDENIKPNPLTGWFM